jgi:hypothetical protein
MNRSFGFVYVLTNQASKARMRASNSSRLSVAAGVSSLCWTMEHGAPRVGLHGHHLVDQAHGQWRSAICCVPNETSGMAGQVAKPGLASPDGRWVWDGHTWQPVVRPGIAT